MLHFEPRSSLHPLTFREGGSADRPTVLLADDHPMMLEGLRKLLEPGCEVVGAATNGRALLAMAVEQRPDLVITDISMPEIDGLEVSRRLETALPETRVLILSVHAEPSWVRAAFAAGACGYLTKSATAEEIELAIGEVLQGHLYVSPRVARSLVAPSPETEPAETEDSLTRRELDVVRLVGSGLGNKEIAQRLGVSVTTVRTHLNRVYDKLRPASRVELALYAAQAV